MNATLHYSPRNVAGALRQLAGEAAFEKHRVRLSHEGKTPAQWLKERLVDIFQETLESNTLEPMAASGSLQIAFRGLGVVYVPVASSTEPFFEFEVLGRPTAALRYSVAFYCYAVGIEDDVLPPWSTSDADARGRHLRVIS